MQICLKANSEYHICSKESFQQEAITSQEGLVERGKSKLFVRGALAWCNYGNWGFQVFLPHAVYVLADWSEINYGNPAVIFHHRVTHILRRTIKIYPHRDFETQLMNVPNNDIGEVISVSDIAEGVIVGHFQT